MMKQPVILLAVMMMTACNSLQKNTGTVGIDINAVKTEAGIVSGVSGGDKSVKIFKGIPFAAPPVGDLRWKPPLPAPHWQGTRKCDVFPPSAMQSKPAPFSMWTKEFMAPEEPLSEDCLYLNLWTAASAANEKRPVMVWIHGGGFTGGSGSVPLYDGEEMAKKGVVFITINYRLGIFGFLAHPELSKESPNKVSGNYGILDQIAALHWVKNNVAAFGGDPERVTIAGQSAGSFSVNALMVSPLAKGLFHRAIGQSGGMFGTNLLIGTDLQNAEISGQKFAETLKVKSIAELRAKSADELMKANGRSGIVIDGTVIPSASEVFAASAQNDVPLMTGWNADEMFFGTPMKANAFKTDAEKKYGDLADEFLKVFPADSDDEAAKSQKLLSALSFGWQNYCWAAMQTKTGRNKAYLYFFSHVPPGEPSFGAFHSAEFGYALKTLKYWNKPFEPWDHQLSDIMSSYWVNFASTGNPNGPGLPVWPAYEQTNSRVMEFGDKAEATALPFQSQLKFLDQYQMANRTGK